MEQLFYHLSSIIELVVWVLALISVGYYGEKKTPDLGWMWIVLYILFSTGWFESMNIFSSDGILGMIFSNLEI
tara:strand:- start:136 stop:354 length:219 start_codon:yes stop_codon:yes gene_type:complete